MFSTNANGIVIAGPEIRYMRRFVDDAKKSGKDLEAFLVECAANEIERLQAMLRQTATTE